MSQGSGLDVLDPYSRLNSVLNTSTAKKFFSKVKNKDVWATMQDQANIKIKQNGFLFYKGLYSLASDTFKSSSRFSKQVFLVFEELFIYSL